MAGIKINAPFELGAAVPVDTRLTLSKAEMLTVNDNVWPSKYLTVCSDDGAIYLYDKTNTMDVETGKFRILSTDLSSCLEKVSTMPAVTEDVALNTTLIYVGNDTAKYKTGHVYTVKIASIEGSYYENGADTSDNVVSANEILSANDTCYVKVDGSPEYYYADTVVESETDNKLYPSTKVDDSDFEIATTYVSYYNDQISLKDFVEAIDVEELIKNKLDKKDTMPTFQPSDLNNQTTFIYVGPSQSEYTVGGLYTAGETDEKILAAFKYAVSSSGDYYDYAFNTENPEIGDVCYVKSSSGSVWLKSTLVASGSGTAIADGIDDSDAELYLPVSAYESSDISGNVYGWKEVYSLKNYQEKVVLKPTEIPAAMDIENTEIFISHASWGPFKQAHSYTSASVSHDTLYAYNSGKYFVDVETLSTDAKVYTYDGNYYTQIAARVQNSSGWKLYLATGMQTSLTRATALDVTSVNAYEYKDVINSVTKVNGALQISAYNINELVANNPYLVQDSTSELHGKTIVLTSLSDTDTYYEWSGQTSSNKIYTKVDTLAEGVKCWIKGSSAYNINNVFFEDTITEVNGTYWSPSTEKDRGNTWHISKSATSVTKSDYTMTYVAWKDANDTSSLEDEIEKRLEKVPVMPTASATTVGEFVMYTGATTSDYITGHVYKGITDGGDPAAYSWVDISPDNFQFATMPAASELQGKVVQYIGETTTVAPIYVKGHFYQSTETSTDVWSWVELDTEVDDYDHIENRPLELTRGAELYNDTVTLDAGDTTSVTLTDKVLVADKKYIISVDGTEHEYTATLDSSDDSINIDASDIGIVISTADSATDSTMVLTNAEFASDPAIIVKEANIVAVNSDYEEFFDNLGKESALSTDVTANTTVGGFEEDDVAPEGMTFTQFATKLLHVYKEPTLAFTSTASTYLLNKDGGVVEQPFTLTATATKQDLDIVETWIEDAEGTKLATGTTTASYVVESNVYDDVTYKAFTKDAKKTIAPKTISYEFIYGFFKGTSATVPEASADVKALTLDLTKKAKKEYTFTASNQYLSVAYPASYGNLTKITDQNGFANLDAWNKTVVAVSMNVWDDTEGDYVATDVNYNVYTTNDKITCSNFKYTFEF